VVGSTAKPPWTAIVSFRTLKQLPYGISVTLNDASFFSIDGRYVMVKLAKIEKGWV